MGARTSLTVYPGMTGIMENAFINVKGRSYNVTADVEVPAGGANGVIIAQAGRFGGWSLYMKGGRAYYVYNFGGLQRFTASSKTPLPPGRHTLRYEFKYRRRTTGIRWYGTAARRWPALRRGPGGAHHALCLLGRRGG